jgi:hypothetical protein
VKYLGLLGIETETTPQTLIARAEAAPLICAVLAAGALAALLMVRASRPRAASLTKGATLAGLIGLSAIDLAIIGPWVWAQDISPVASRRQYSIDRLDAESLEVPRAWGETVMLASTFNVGVLSNWYFKRYVAFLDRARGEPEAADRLLGVRDGRRLFVTSAIDPPTIHAFLDDAARRAELPRVEGYTGDELTVSVRMVADGYLTFIDNWDPDWRAYVDDHPVPIDLLFGTFKAVRIPAGQHRLTFVYRPTMWPVRWGALIQR